MEYEVSYTIEVDAESPLDAALLVENILKNPTSRPYLKVENGDGAVDFDLDDLKYEGCIASKKEK